ALRGQLPTEKSVQVEIAGLYWHFVDGIWMHNFTVVDLVPNKHQGEHSEWPTTNPRQRSQPRGRRRRRSWKPPPGTTRCCTAASSTPTRARSSTSGSPSSWPSSPPSRSASTT